MTATGAPPAAAPGDAAGRPPRPRPGARRTGPLGVRAGGIRLAGALAVVTALAATAGAGFHRVFAAGDLAPRLAVAAVCPVALSALISWPRRRPWPLWASIAATVAAWTLLTGLTLFHGDFMVVGGALRDSWKATLTSLLPAPARPELLVLPHTLVWFAAVTGAELALRTKAKAAPALPAIAAFAVALLLSVGGPGSNLPVAAALLGLVAVLTIVRAGGRPGRLLAGTAAGAAVTAVAVAAGPLLPRAGEPYDPRETVQAPPPQQRDSISPLDRVSAWLQAPDQQMFTVRAAAPENWRLAVLDRFDGVTWSSGGRFVPAGTLLPGEDGARGTRVEQHVTVQQLPGVWVPAADRPRAIQGLGVTVDPRSGVLTSVRPLRPGQTYTVTSLVRDYDPDELATAAPARDAEAREATDLPESPGTTARTAQVPGFRRIAERVTAGQDTAFERAARLAEYLRTTARYDPAGLPGHTYEQLRYFLTRRRGTSEQFACAYAVLARSIGLPARVVVGFRPGIGANGVWQVRSGDVLVWPEVDFAGIGWVPFFPTPERAGRSGRSDSVPTGETQQKLEAAQKSAASRKGGDGPGGRDRPTPSPPPAATRRPAAAPVPWGTYGLAAGAALPVLYLLAVLIVPVVRRRRRRAGATPAERIAGAWRQTLEALHAAGLPKSGSLTAHEVAGFGSGRIDGAEPHLRSLADLVNRSAYAGASPGPAAAEAAWRHADEIGRLAARATGPVRRLGRRLHPRSLRLR